LLKVDASGANIVVSQSGIAAGREATDGGARTAGPGERVHYSGGGEGEEEGGDDGELHVYEGIEGSAGSRRRSDSKAPDREDWLAGGFVGEL
jgi:hypothetical protein